MNTDLATIKDVSNWSLEQITMLGRVLAKSGYFKGVKEEAQAVVKILYGQELGVSPIAAMRGVFIDANGGISLSAGLISAMILRSGKYMYNVVQSTADVCEIDFLRDGEKVGNVKLTMSEARASNMNQQWDSEKGAWKEKHTWKSYPSDMLFARCVTRGARRFCPDVFLGPVYVPDELDSRAPESAYEVVTVQSVDVQEQPAQLPTTTTPPDAPTESATKRAPVAKCAIKTGKWRDIANSLPAYYAHPQHALNALAAAGYAEVTDSNLAEVSQFLLDHAVKKAEEQERAQAAA